MMLIRYEQPWIEEMISKQAQTKAEIASFTIPHTFFIVGISPDCILGREFLTKMVAKVDFKAKQLHLHQGDKTGTD